MSTSASAPTDSPDLITSIAVTLGASPPALRLLVSILLSYPITLFHRLFLYPHSSKIHENIHHIYYIIAGSWLAYYNYTSSLLHAYVCILVHYVTLKLTRGSKAGTFFIFLFQMGYLLYLYWTTETRLYDIKWTIPHCVMTLRLIGQGFDYYDEKVKKRRESPDAEHPLPTLLQISAHVFYPPSFLIGPQFPLSRYMKFVNGTLIHQRKENDKKNEDKDDNDSIIPNFNQPTSIGPSLKRLCIGIMYVAIYQVGALVINNDLIMSEKYENLPLLYKLLIVGIYGKILLYKYVSCWIVAEGACILSGITFNGYETTTGKPRWDGCENINVWVFERAYKFSHLISSFNKCTNAWVATHIYKRLKPLNNRHISQGAALIFLAVWHGFHSGYYMCFGMEFLVMNVEKDLTTLFNSSAKLVRLTSSPVGFYTSAAVSKLLVTIFFGYCTLPFGLLSMEKWIKSYSDLYWCGTIGFGIGALVVGHFVTMVKTRQKKAAATSSSTSTASSEHLGKMTDNNKKTE